MSSTLEPADLIIEFLYIPKLVYFCAFFAYEGLKNGVTLTHSGMGKGVIARVYGLLYLLTGAIALLMIPSLLRELLAVDQNELRQALTLSISSPEVGLIFLGFALFLFFMRERLIFAGAKRLKRTTRNVHRIEAGRKFTNWMIAMIFAIGVPPLLGMPYFFTVGVYAFFIYFAPFTSPIAVKRLMSMPIDKNEQPSEAGFSRTGSL